MKVSQQIGYVYLKLPNACMYTRGLLENSYSKKIEFRILLTTSVFHSRVSYLRFQRIKTFLKLKKERKVDEYYVYESKYLGLSHHNV